MILLIVGYCAADESFRLISISTDLRS